MAFILYMFEYLFLFLLGYGLLTQVVIPLYSGLPVFPWFRVRQVEDQLADVKEDLFKARVQSVIRELEKEVEAEKAKGEDNVSGS